MLFLTRYALDTSHYERNYLQVSVLKPNSVGLHRCTVIHEGLGSENAWG